MKTLRVALPLALLLVLPVMAGEVDKAWLGRQFLPEQCVAIESGAALFARKLCRIDYRMANTAEGFAVDGYLSFNPKFVPRLPRSLDLEILLIDKDFVCIDQINLNREVVAPPVHFNVLVPADSDAAYLRTYYILHYE